MRAGVQDALLAVPTSAERTVDGAGVRAPVARVLLDSPVPHLDRCFDYIVPPALDQAAAVGTRVVVRFGGQELQGWVWERGSTTTHTGRLTPVRRVVSDLPVLTSRTVRLIEAAAERTAGTRADVIRLAVPPRHATTERSQRAVPRPALPSWSAPQASESGWVTYDNGVAVMEALASGGAPRAVWSALPASDRTEDSDGTSRSDRAGDAVDWQHLVAQALRYTLASGRGGIIVVPTTAQAEVLAARLTRELDGEDVVVLCSEHGPARRYRAFVKLLLGHARVVVGTRGAAFAPVGDLGLAVIWDDGDDRLVERHAPYIHSRTVLALRSQMEQTGMLIGGYSRTVEAQSLVERGWAVDLRASREVVRRCVPRIQVPGRPELDAEGDSGRARIPSLALRALRTVLQNGPALVQVPRGGYAPVLSCSTCRTPARCPTCAGPLSMARDGIISCRWCARTTTAWRCQTCAGTTVRMVGVGSTRTGEELGRALPGIPVVVSGARAEHGMVATVDDQPRLVVATPGAEPVADGGYHGVLLLDGAVLSARPELGASNEALRRWSNAVALARPDARVLLLGGPAETVAQALLRWDHAGFARRELEERAQLGLPPAVRCARLDGPVDAVETLVQQARAQGWDVLGPVTPGNGTLGRALVRVPWRRGRELAHMLRLRVRERSAHREQPVRVELDPTLLW